MKPSILHTSTADLKRSGASPLAERTMLNLETKLGVVLMGVKVVPGASRTKVVGVLDGRLKVTVAAPAEKGKANAALTALLARRLGLSRRDVSIETGHGSPLKTVRLANIDADTVREAFEPAAGRK